MYVSILRVLFGCLVFLFCVACEKSSPDLLRPEKSEIVFALPQGWKINDLGPTRIKLYRDDSEIQQYERKDIQDTKITLPTLELGVRYRLWGMVLFCEIQNPKLCLTQKIKFEFQADASGLNQKILPLEPKH